jgi:DNA polymerase-3 subunit epsilon/ATP-dependent DNA helicase DinG
MPEIVALDLETTGLDPKNDAIIEIGAVKFNGNRVIAEFSKLINPRKPINSFITNLTGISNAMVMNAPVIGDVLPEIEEFIGDAIILGQNIDFDLGFLHRYGAIKYNETIDTYEIASVVMPSAPRYGLGSLANQLGVILTNAHRALDDARATMQVFQQLQLKIAELPFELVSEILRLARNLQWQGELPFRWAQKNLANQGILPHTGGSDEDDLFIRLEKAGKPKILEPSEVLQKLDCEELAALLEPGGVFAKYNPGFEHRSQQVEMLRSVCQALNHGDHLMVEAGTGTGKSLAYLIPAAFWAMQNGERVVISTNTIALQDQLIGKDIPDLIQALGIDLKAAVLKGRANYLCPRRLKQMRKRSPESVDELRVLSKVLVWLHSGGSGDRREINLNGTMERMVWSRLSAEDDSCSLDTCLRRMGGTCPFYKARVAAESSHILVVNHALLLADASVENQVLPAYHYLIVDEAHHLESATTDAMSFSLRALDVTRLIRELGNSEQGILGRLVGMVGPALMPSDLAALLQTINAASERAFRFDTGMTAFFKALDFLLEELREGKPLGTYPQKTRLLPSTRTIPAWLDVELAWEQAKNDLDELLKILKMIRTSVQGVDGISPEDAEDSLGTLARATQSLNEIGLKLEELTMSPSEEQIYWVEIDPLQMRLSLQIAPLHIGSLMEKYLWHQKASVILTSATLTTHGEFDYLKLRLNGEDANELMVGSPFDYETSAMLYLPQDIPEPTDNYGHQKTLEDTIIRLAKVSGGHMLVLFTSYAQLQRTSQNIQSALNKADIQVFEQGEGASATALLETFKETPRAVLLGTRSFWEGVDVPGEALQVLVIAKLPFEVPSDPIVAARSESFDDPFNQYMIPEAILRFRQGFGRLIRTKSDRGIVVIMDKRVISKAYGRLFIESLPRCNTIKGSLLNLPEQAAQWLN